MSTLNPLYLAEVNLPRSRARVFIETDRDSNSRAHVIGLMASGEIDAVKVIEMIEPCEDFPQGFVRDVTLELQLEASVMMEAA